MIGALTTGIIASLFLLAVITKRRFGALGLGLAAGVLLNLQFNRPLAAWLESSAVRLEPFAAETLATVAIVLTPALLLLLGGPKYQTVRSALMGGLGFVVMAVALLLEPLSRDSFWVAETFRPLVEFLAEWQGMVVAVGVAVAVGDMFMARPHRAASKKRH